MSISVKPILLRQGFNELPCTGISGVSTYFHFQKLKSSPLNHNLSRVSCSMKSRSNGSGMPDAHVNMPDVQGSMEMNEHSGRSLSSNEMLEKLKRYGISGILSYGLLNTAYYLTTFLVLWLYVAPAPGKMGYFAAVQRLLKMMAMVWAGSQVTKLIRAGGALALAPLVDRGLSWFTVRFKFQSKGKAFLAIAGICFGLAFFLFLIMTVLWA